MALGVLGVRPALFSEESLKRGVLELLKFRHRFRNLYGEDLDPKKTAEVHRAANEFVEAFAKSHVDFVAKLHAIADELE